MVVLDRREGEERITNKDIPAQKPVILVPKQLKIAESTHRRLTDIARKDQTYDEVINMCIDAFLREKEREATTSGRKGK